MRRPLNLLSLLAVGSVVLFAAGCVTAAPAPALPASSTPPAMDVPSGNSLLARLGAKGVQIYTCAAGKDGGYAWTFKAPEAELTDAGGAPAGKHFAGPTWEWTNGSSVVGEVLQKVPAQAGNIPWLLLKVKASKQTSPYGSVAFIQRLDTLGGTAPTTGCDQAHESAEAKVPYTASYAFWGAK